MLQFLNNLYVKYMRISHRDNNSEGGEFYDKLQAFMSKFGDEYTQWYKQNMRRRYYYLYFKDNEKLLSLVMLKPELLKSAYTMLQKKRKD